MTRTPEQIAAESALEQAFRAVAVAYGNSDPGLVGDWIAVVECPSMDGNAGETPYAMYVAGGSLPRHRLAGLIDVADGIAASAWERADDD